MRRPVCCRAGPWSRNLSGGDWDGVELTLVSGNPVTFRQAIYTAYYVDRPEVPVEVLGRVLPRPDHGALRSAGVASSDFGMRKAEEGMSDMVAAPSMLAELAGDAVSVQQLAYAEAPSMAPAQMIAAQSEEAATQVMFRVPYAVSLESGRSLMVPIHQRRGAVAPAGPLPAGHSRQPSAGLHRPHQ